MIQNLKSSFSINNFNYFIYFIFLDITFIVSIILSIINLSLINNNNIEILKREIFQNNIFPLFHFYIGLDSPSPEYISYDSFYTWQGTLKSSKQELAPVEINKIFQNKFFYVKSNKTYFDYLKNSVKQGEDCKNNYKKCGILDSNNNILCLPENEECPLNDIKISELEDPYLINEYNHIQVFESITGIKKFIYFTNNKIDNNIITKLELNFDNPCIAVNEYSWISNNLNEKEKTRSCRTYINNKIYDPLYVEICNNIHMKSLYYDNGIQIYNDFSSEKVKLFIRNYYYIDETCANEYIKGYDNIEKITNNKISKIKILEYINIPLILIHFVLFFYILKNKKKILLFIIILNIFIICLAIINCILFFYLNDEKNLVFSCGTDIFNSKINNFTNKNLIILRKPKLFIFIDLVISLIELIIQNYIICIIKKSSFRHLSTKSDIM